MPQVKVFAANSDNSAQTQQTTSQKNDETYNLVKSNDSKDTQTVSTTQKKPETVQYSLASAQNNSNGQGLQDSKVQEPDVDKMSKGANEAKQEALQDLQNAPTRNPMKTQQSLLSNGYSAVYAQAYQDFYQGYLDGEQDATVSNKTNAQQGFATQYPGSYSPEKKAGYDAAKNDYKMTTEKK